MIIKRLNSVHIRAILIYCYTRIHPNCVIRYINLHRYLHNLVEDIVYHIGFTEAHLIFMVNKAAKKHLSTIKCLWLSLYRLRNSALQDALES